MKWNLFNISWKRVWKNMQITTKPGFMFIYYKFCKKWRKSKEFLNLQLSKMSAKSDETMKKVCHQHQIILKAEPQIEIIWWSLTSNCSETYLKVYKNHSLKAYAFWGRTSGTVTVIYVSDLHHYREKNCLFNLIWRILHWTV